MKCVERPRNIHLLIVEIDDISIVLYEVYREMYRISKLAKIGMETMYWHVGVV